MNKPVKKRKEPGGLPASVLVFVVLLLVAAIPLVTFAFFTSSVVQSSLYALNEQYEMNEMAQDLEILRAELESSRTMIGFVSQLPAAIEILRRGEERQGAIDMATAYKRYTGVLRRAFRQTENIDSVYILDGDQQMIFALKKDAGTGSYQRYSGEPPFIAPLFLEKTSAMVEKGFYLSPLLQTGEEGPSAQPQLKVQLLTPIFFEKESIGTFVSEIDITTFVLVYPEIAWVLNDGRFVSGDAPGSDAFAQIEGIEQLFASQNQGILEDGDGNTSVWMPFLQGSDVDLSLWAGKNIELAFFQSVKQRVFTTILSIFGVLLLGVVLVSLVTSRMIKKVFARQVEYLSSSLLQKNQPVEQPSTSINEIKQYNIQLDRILQSNQQLREESEQYQRELEQALAEVKQLRGIIPICSYCKKIRDDGGDWSRLEEYIQQHSDAQFSHGICDDCMEEHLPKKE